MFPPDPTTWYRVLYQYISQLLQISFQLASMNFTGLVSQPALAVMSALRRAAGQSAAAENN